MNRVPVNLDNKPQTMNLPKRNSRVRVKQLAPGQVWQTQKSKLHVKDIGKFLVHYKLFQGNAQKTATTVSSITAVENYLSHNRATLIRNELPGTK